MESFALFRMPFQKECRCIMTAATPRMVSSVKDIDDSPGFVIAPFTPGDSEPIILIDRPQAECFTSEQSIPASLLDALDAACRLNTVADDGDHPGRSDYSNDFSRFHSRLADSTFSKLVLARKKTIPGDSANWPTSLFLKACASYPRCFIALFSTPISGTWLVATPELLIEKRGSECHTMALAGTMEYTGDPEPRWSTKNIREQQCVTEYIRDAISPFAGHVSIDGPHTVRAAGLVHLRSDFSLSLSEGSLTGDVLDALHPTPAVCGLPASAAHDFIVANEHSPRSYYSGFCGPVSIDGVTSLFVTLRCMRLRPGACDLYAGSGLLVDSTEASEWEETEAKMKTMYNLL